MQDGVTWRWGQGLEVGDRRHDGTGSRAGGWGAGGAAWEGGGRDEGQRRRGVGGWRQEQSAGGRQLTARHGRVEVGKGA
jgi:hypothetical protein